MINLALEKYGTISLERALQPAIKLAERGFPVTQDFYNSLTFARRLLERDSETQAIFLPNNNNPPAIGTIFQQPDLANSLKLIAQQGKKAFYQGKIAQEIVKEMEKNQGMISLADLDNYQPVIIANNKTIMRSYSTLPY